MSATRSLLIALFMFPAVASLVFAGTEERRLQVLFTCDTRGLMLSKKVDGRLQGGLALRKPHLEHLREASPDATLTVSPGNILFPGYLGMLDEGRTIVDVYGGLGYDAVGVGPSDLDLGLEVLEQRALEAEYPVICSNLVFKGKKFAPGLPARRRSKSGGIFPFAPSVIVKKGALNVGIVSVINPAVVGVASRLAEKIEAVDPLKAAGESASFLKSRGADVVLVLSSVGFDDSMALADLPGVDFVVRTRTKTSLRKLRRLYEFRLPHGKAVISVPFGGGGVYIGRAVLTVKKGKTDLSRVTLHTIDDSFSPDPEMTKVIEELEQKLRHSHSRVITEFDKATAAAFPELCAEIFREKLDCEVAVVNTSYFQSTASAGKFRLIDLRRITPFHDTLARVPMKGSELKKLLEDYSDKLVTAGIEKRGKKYVVNGRLLDGDTGYSVATLSYMAGGGTGMMEHSAGITDIVARQVIEKRLSGLDEVSLKQFRYLWNRPLEIISGSVVASASRIVANSTVADYAGSSVPGLATEDSRKFHSLVNFEWIHNKPRSDLISTLEAKYDTLDSERTLDQLVLGFRYQRKPTLEGPRPYVGIELDTTLTSSTLTGEDRPYKGKLTAGRAYELSRFLTGRFGISGVWFFGSLEQDETLGGDITLEFARDFDSGLRCTSKLNWFSSLTGNDQVNQGRLETELSVKVYKRLTMNFRTNTVLFSDDGIGGTAMSTEYYFGFGYRLSLRRW